MMAKREIKREGIKKERLIFCEGIDEKNFLIKWLNSEALADESGFANDIQVIDFGGNEDLPKALEFYKGIGSLDPVTYLLIIRDAEQDAQGAIQSIQGALEHNGFQVPEAPCQWTYDDENDLELGFLLFPTCDGNPTAGTLEDLCLKILAEPDAPVCMDEVNRLLSRLENEHGKIFKHKFKTQLHAYFAVSDEYVGMKVGEAASAKAFDWKSTELDPLKSFVRHMIQ